MSGYLVCRYGPVADSSTLKNLEDFGNYKRDASGKKIGLSWARASKLYVALLESDLVYKQNDGWNIPDKYKEWLRKVALNKTVKPIFGSPPALELYRLLKRDHMFVYPEIPICAFIDRSTVEHLFLEGWHNSYFLMCRVDFVVCESNDGIPQFVVEYQGSYHENKEQIKKDQFKRTVLEFAGIPFREITHADLTEMKREGEFE